MLFPLAGLVLGALIGALRARARGGKALDMAQWGAVFAIIFGLIGLFALVFIERGLIAG